MKPCRSLLPATSGCGNAINRALLHVIPARGSQEPRAGVSTPTPPDPLLRNACLFFAYAHPPCPFAHFSKQERNFPEAFFAC
jgi:hypothetical protein